MCVTSSLSVFNTNRTPRLYSFASSISRRWPCLGGANLPNRAKREEFLRCLRGMRVSLSAREGGRLFSALLPTTTEAGGARYPELIDFLRSKNARWYDVEREIADKVGAALVPIFGKGLEGSVPCCHPRPVKHDVRPRLLSVWRRTDRWCFLRPRLFTHKCFEEVS